MRGIKEILLDGWSRSLIFLTISIIAVVVSFFNIGDLPFDAAWIAVILCGIPIIIGSVMEIWECRDITAEVLVAIALIASVAIGEIFAAGEIASIMALGAILEQRTVRKAREGIERLVNLTPPTARVIRNGIEEVIPASEVRIGDRLRILAGETIPVDGTILKGRTSIDQSVLTGESLPVDKEEGDEIFSGTINQIGTFDMKAAANESDSSLQKMIRLVNSADVGKAKIVRIADRWAKWIVIAAIASALFAWAVTGEVIRAVTVLVVFCPCALVLATPTALVAAIGNVTRYGMLVKSGDAIERLSGVSRVVFDKTGTLTYGKPSVVSVNAFSAAFTEDEIVSLAASAEMRSEHPLGKAVMRYAEERSMKLQEPSDFDLLIGRGVSAVVKGKTILAGNSKLMNEMGIDIESVISSDVQECLDGGCTVMYIAIDNRIAGSIVISDTVREESYRTIKELEDIGLKYTMLTGDSQSCAESVAKGISISSVVSDCLPENKVETIRMFERNGEKVCMIGDGINDAPALKTATVGIAMGKIGSDIAVDAADIALVGDDIQNIPHLMRLSRRTMRTIKLNILFSLTLNFIAIGLAMTGILTPVTGALVHNAGSVFVVLNSALLLNWRYRKHGKKHSETKGHRSFQRMQDTASDV